MSKVHFRPHFVTVHTECSQMQSKYIQNAVKMQSKYRQNADKIQSKFSQNSVKIQSKCSPQIWWLLDWNCCFNRASMAARERNCFPRERISVRFHSKSTRSNQNCKRAPLATLAPPQTKKGQVPCWGVKNGLNFHLVDLRKGDRK